MKDSCSIHPDRDILGLQGKLSSNEFGQLRSYKSGTQLKPRYGALLTWGNAGPGQEKGKVYSPTRIFGTKVSDCPICFL